MKQALNNLILVLAVSLILAFTSGCATKEYHPISCIVIINNVQYNCECTGDVNGIVYNTQCKVQ